MSLDTSRPCNPELYSQDGSDADVSMSEDLRDPWHPRHEPHNLHTFKAQPKNGSLQSAVPIEAHNTEDIETAALSELSSNPLLAA